MLKPGTKVILKNDPEEGWPEEHAIVVEDDVEHDVVLVEVSPEDEDDDGLREVTHDQILVLEEWPTHPLNGGVE